MEPLRGKGDRGRELGPWNESLEGVGTLVPALYFPINTWFLQDIRSHHRLKAIGSSDPTAILSKLRAQIYPPFMII